MVEALLHPMKVSTSDRGIEQWGKHVGVVWDHATDEIAKCRVKVIITVKLSGSSEATWEEDARDLAQCRTSFLDAEELLRVIEGPVPYERKRRPKPSQAPVTVRNVFEDVPPAMLATARMLLRQAGLNENDLSRVRRVGPGRLEITELR